MSRTSLLWRGGVAGVVLAVGLLGAISPAQAIERQFLGIRMLSRVQTVLARFGNPTQVTVGQTAYNLPGQQVGMGGAAPAPGRPGMAGIPGVPGAPGMPMIAGGAMMGGPSPYAGYGAMMSPPSGMGPMAGAPVMPGGRAGMMTGMGGGMRGDYEEDYSAPMGAAGGAPMAAGSAFGSAPGLPGLPGGIGVPRPGMAGSVGAPGLPGIGGAAGGVGLPSVGLRSTPGSTIYEQETTLVYERPGGVIYEFLVNKDGYVVQAKAIGYEDKSGLARTSRGIRLGDTYQRVLAVYGWPKEHVNMGTTLYISYPNYHVAFQFYNNRVVSIIVAAMEK